MRVRIGREALHGIVASALRATASRSTMPTLSCVLLDAHDGALEATGTDLEIAITARQDGVAVVEPGRVLVPAKILAETVRRFGDGEVELEADGHNLVVRWQRARYRIAGQDPTLAATMPGAHEFIATLDADTLRTMASCVVPAIGTDESRPILTGALLVTDAKEGRIHVTATDGFRVATADIAATCVTEGTSMVVPGRALREVQRLRETVELRRGESVAMFHTPSLTVMTMLLDGTYPNLHEILPKDYSVTVTCDAHALAGALDRAGLIAGTMSPATRKPMVHLALEPSRLVITAKGEEGTAREEVDADILGDPAAAELDKVAYDARYLLDGLRPVVGEVTVAFRGGLSPARIRGGDGYTYWCLPIKL